jgi:hypothetical protein
MKISFKQYLTEAISLDMVKKSLVGKPVWDYKKDLSDEFGDRYRIVVGQIKPNIERDLDEHPIYNTLEKIFIDKGFILTKQGYIEGLVTKDKQQFKIGKILKKWYDQGWLTPLGLGDSFRDDPMRVKNKKPYKVVVSKHPYDVLGASTDRNWTSCVNLGGGIIYSDSKKDDKGMNADRLVNSLHAPFMIAYLVDPDDVNNDGKLMIRRPLSRIMIYPFEGRNNTEEEKDYNWSVGDVYGADNNEFYEIVSNWVSNINEKYSKSDKYSKFEDVYYDSFDEELVKIWLDVDELEEDFNQNISEDTITIGSIEEIQYGYGFYDLTLKKLIPKDVLNNPFIQSTEFKYHYFQDIIRELILYHTGVSVIINDVDDIEIYDIDYNDGDVTLSNISIVQVPEKLKKMYDEDQFQDSMGPHYVLGMVLEYLKKYCLNDYDYYKNGIDSNLEVFFEELTKRVGDLLLHKGVDPVAENWDKLEDEEIDEIIGELKGDFAI